MCIDTRQYLFKKSPVQIHKTLSHKTKRKSSLHAIGGDPQIKNMNEKLPTLNK